MKLLTKAIEDRLIKNGKLRASRQEEGRDEPNFCPVVKLFTPDANCTWLLTEIDPDEPDIAFGLCDLGLGFPEIGNVSLSEIASLTGRVGLSVERDLHFKASKTLTAYADEARERGSIRA